jgi:hypothetical protein
MQSVGPEPATPGPACFRQSAGTSQNPSPARRPTPSRASHRTARPHQIPPSPSSPPSKNSNRQRSPPHRPVEPNRAAAIPQAALKASREPRGRADCEIANRSCQSRKRSTRCPLGAIRDDLTPHVAHFATCALEVNDLDPIGHSTILSLASWASSWARFIFCRLRRNGLALMAPVLPLPVMPKRSRDLKYRVPLKSIPRGYGGSFSVSRAGAAQVGPSLDGSTLTKSATVKIIPAFQEK